MSLFLTFSAFFVCVAVMAAAYVAITLSRHTDTHLELMKERLKELDRHMDMQKLMERKEKEIDEFTSGLRVEVAKKVNAAVEEFVGIYREKSEIYSLEEASPKDEIVNEDINEEAYLKWKFGTSL
jgi:exonuclease VII large subunit